MKYNHQKVEKKWAQVWQKEKTYEPDFKDPSPPAGGSGRRDRRFYNLMMFPYPSAEGLHVGNMYAFTGSDIYGRFKRMQGHNVFEPIGLDGFGIHSENYALKINVHPKKQSKISEKRFYKQLQSIGNGFSFDERLETYDPEYYRWTQWVFIQLFNRGLAYRKKQAVNWCLSCKTVLADEQVVGGECERCSSQVIQKELEQWFFKITAYAEKLLGNLENLDWSERVKIAQKNWIGKSEGSLIKFQVKSEKLKVEESLEVFTTRPDTLFGATYVVLAPEHEIVKNLEFRINNLEEVNKYIQKAQKATDIDRTNETKEKTGVELLGIKAINPANQELLPIFVADYVLGGIGTGAIMAVPAHDQRDWDFAQKFNLPIRQVVAPVITLRGIETPCQDKPVSKRKVTSAIVRNSTNGKYLLLRWPNGGCGFIGGGVEDGETFEQAVTREIKEESGYIDFSVSKKIPIAFYGNGYKARKDINCFDYEEVFFVELSSERQQLLHKDDIGVHEYFWATEDEVGKLVTKDHHLAFWQWYQQGVGCHTGQGLLINSSQFDGLESEIAKEEIRKLVGGVKKTKYRLRDWLISRQRYWGPPIPMIFCQSCADKVKDDTSVILSDSEGSKLKIKTTFNLGELENPGWFAVPEKDLPVELPNLKNFSPKGTRESPLASSKSFSETTCPHCHKKARRETDVSDTFLDSAWYFFRYLDSNNKKQVFDPKLINQWLPVDMYIGGAEHSVLHLLYSRFITMVFKDLKLVNFDEPFKKFRAHGLVIKDGAKMSKSKGNVITPDPYLKKFGADILRTYLMFLSPFEAGGDFRDENIFGVKRFLDRVYKLIIDHKAQDNNSPSDKKIEKLLHKTIKKVTEDIENLHYNTAVSALMILLNEMEKQNQQLSIIHYQLFIKLLAPFAPYMTEELWEKLGHKNSIHREGWPKYNPKLIIDETYTLIIQINGKTRSQLEVNKNITQVEVESKALSDEMVKKWIGTHSIKKTIFVSGKLINFVV